MLKKFVLGGMVVVAALLGNACGDDGSSESPAGPADSEVTLSSSSEDVISGNGSSSSVTESPSTSSGQAPQSAESDGSSSSEKAVGGSSSSDGKASSSSGKVESSSSGKDEKSSSSDGAAGSSSSDVVAESSSSEKSSSSMAESSSSVESSSSEEPSSSSVVESSSSVAESSSSSEDDVSSSSEYYKSNWAYLDKNVVYDTIIDSRDNQVYKVVTIGSQTWMAENLNYYDAEQNSYLIEHSWCYNNIESTCSVHGRLYDVSAALGYDQNQIKLRTYLKSLDTNHIQGICPDGWRIPLVNDLEKISNYARTALVSSSYQNWTKGNNSTGLSLIPSGYAYFYNDNRETNPDILFQNINKLTNLLSATYYGLVSSVQVLTVTNNSVEFSKANFVNAGYSVRCIKDSE